MRGRLQGQLDIGFESRGMGAVVGGRGGRTPRAKCRVTNDPLDLHVVER